MLTRTMRNEKHRFVNMPKSSHILGFDRIFETTSNIAKLATSFKRKVGVKKALLVIQSLEPPEVG